ncbi:ABC transporter permease [Dolichospermum sp. ST_sed1]|nr:ABC transporter permease [Dolichospermum sp. ST_sed1]
MTTTTVNNLEIDNNEGESLTKRALRKISTKPMVLISFAIVGLYICLAILSAAGLLPDFQERVGLPNEAPSLVFAKILGTDLFGRSILYKVLAGLQVSMTLGFGVTLISVPIGVTLGTLAGYFGGKVDGFIIWLYTTLTSIPAILLLMAITFALGKGLMSMCIAMGVTYWVGLCRMTRGEVLKHKEREYVMAAELLGAKKFYIMFRHIVPNVIHIAITYSALMVLDAIKNEVILSYLGLGGNSGASWGAMIEAVPGELTNGIWWPLVSVVVAMFFIIYALSVVGDALRDALDPKLV